MLVQLAAALGVTLDCASSADVRAAIAAEVAGFAGLGSLAFERPMSASTWLEASNPSERWKWEFLYQDLPPVKGHNVQMENVLPSGAIPLTPVAAKP